MIDRKPRQPRVETRGYMPSSLRDEEWRQYLAAFLLLTLLLAAPAAAKVHSRWDRGADFSSYETFRWQDSEKPMGPRVSPGGVLYDPIRELVVAALESEGLREVEDGEADLLVHFEAVATPVMDMGALRRDVAPGIAWVVDGPMRSYYEGTLVVVLTDAETGQPVWSGWTTQQIEGDHERPTDEVKLVKVARKVTKKIMKRYPPRD